MSAHFVGLVKLEKDSEVSIHALFSRLVRKEESSDCTLEHTCIDVGTMAQISNNDTKYGRGMREYSRNRGISPRLISHALRKAAYARVRGEVGDSDVKDLQTVQDFLAAFSLLKNALKPKM